MNDPPASLPPRRATVWLSPATGVFLVLWVTLLLAGRSKLLQDPGTFWHTVLGQRLLATGEFTYTDSFTFTFAGERWLTLQWLGEAVMAVAYRIGGWDTLLLLTVTILAATYAWLASRLMRSGLYWLPAAVVVALVIAASSHHFHVRPHLATIALLGLTMAMLCDVESGRASIHRLWWLVPVFALWTNLHGGVLGGLATVVFAAVGWCGRWIVGAMRREARNVGNRPIKTIGQCVLLAAILLSLAASLLLNPYGLEMPRAWLRIMAMPLPALIQEHRPLDLWRPEGAFIVVLAAGYLWLLLDAVRGKRRLHVTWLLPLIWLCLAMTRVRHAPLFAMTAAVAFSDLLPYSRFASWLAKWELFSLAPTGGSPLFPRGSTPATRRMRTMAVPAAVVVGAVLTQSLGLTVPVIGRGWARHDAGRWPVEVLPQLRQLEAADPGTPIFNTLDFGGFLAFHTPRLPTFIDDRCELFGDAFLSEYGRAESEQPERIDDWADRYGFKVALVRSGSPFDHYLRFNAAWQPMHRTRAATLYQRGRVVP